jgi:hypothetical protein
MGPDRIVIPSLSQYARSPPQPFSFVESRNLCALRRIMCWWSHSEARIPFRLACGGRARSGLDCRETNPLGSSSLSAQRADIRREVRGFRPA